LQRVVDSIKGDNINTADVVEQLKQEIMPLKQVSTSQYASYNKLYQPSYSDTRIFEAPFDIKIRNHFDNDAYFSHVRIEGGSRDKALMELQSDLMQHKDRIDAVGK